MSQKQYVEEILERFNMQDCNARLTPCEQQLKYREAVGRLIDVATVSKLSQDSTN